MARVARSIHYLFARRVRAPLALTACVAAALVIGCSAESPVVGGNPQAKAAMTVVGMQYAEFLGAHGGKAPQDDAEMRQFLESRLEDLKMYNVTSIDQLLSAGRDGKPIKIVTGKTIPTADQGGQYLWAAYESEGLDGVRLAVNSRGGVYELSNDEFAKQIPGQ